MMQATDKKVKSDAGFALFVVLSFLLIATSVTVPFLMNSKISALVSRNTVQTTREKELLRGILLVTALRYYELYQIRQSRPVRAVSCVFPEISLSLNIQDHSGLIDLNAASADLLSLGFLSYDLPSLTALRLAETVVRFRSVDAAISSPENGLAVRNGYKNALFEDVEELHDLLVAANTPIANLHHVFTVQSGTGTIDAATAPKQLLAVIEERPAIDRYFLVNDTRRINAISVFVEISNQNGSETSARATFGPSGNEALPVFLSPVKLNQKSDAREASARDGKVNCDQFFDQQMLQALAEAMS
jgi:hypothetical protein